MICPNCKLDVEMIDDSGIIEDGEYKIYLECPDCGARLVGEIAISELEQLPSMLDID